MPLRAHLCRVKPMLESPATSPVQPRRALEPLRCLRPAITDHIATSDPSPLPPHGPEPSSALPTSAPLSTRRCFSAPLLL
ncbi:hypothetical protein M0R45_028939 [Rubus argutus]|uniref:Uncharacterized protein n=1 Tax=Rubus argutus TaxID=59490 RepID=A0AAW1WA72_RUBAR